MVGALAYGVWATAKGSWVLNVERERVTISTVKRGEFQELNAVTGTAIPEKTVYLSVVERGRVEEILVLTGAMVEGGEHIVRRSNNDLRLQLARTEA